MSPRSQAFRQAVWFAFRASQFAGALIRRNPQRRRRLEIIFIFRSDYAALRFAAWTESGIYNHQRDLDVIQLKGADLSPRWCVALPFSVRRRIDQPIAVELIGGLRGVQTFAAHLAEI